MSSTGQPALAKLLTYDQQQALAERLSALMDVGYGELTIVVRAGRLRFLRLVTSQQEPLALSEDMDIMPSEGDP